MTHAPFSSAVPRKQIPIRHDPPTRSPRRSCKADSCELKDDSVLDSLFRLASGRPLFDGSNYEGH